MALQKRAPKPLFIAPWINACLAISRPENQVVILQYGQVRPVPEAFERHFLVDLEDLVMYLKRDC